LMAEKPIPFAKTNEFYAALGFFYAIWSQIELTIDYATWKAIGEAETPEEAHARTAGAKFSDKCKELRSLLKGKNIPHSENMKEILTQIEDSMRNVFAHSFMATDEHSVTFVYRKKGRGKRGKYEVTAYEFSRQDFFSHVKNFQQLLSELNKHVVGESEKEFRTFAASAIPVARSSRHPSPSSD
jgi:hypothetical protein